MIELTEEEERSIIEAREIKSKENYFSTPRKIGYLKADLYSGYADCGISDSGYVFEEEKEDFIKRNIRFTLVLKKGTKFTAYSVSYYNKSCAWTSKGIWNVNVNDAWAEKHLENIEEIK